MIKTFPIIEQADRVIERGGSPADLSQWFSDPLDSLMYYSARRPRFFPAHSPRECCDFCGSANVAGMVVMTWQASMSMVAMGVVGELAAALLGFMGYRIIEFETHHTVCEECRRVASSRLSSRRVLKGALPLLPLAGVPLLVIGMVEIFSAEVRGEEREIFIWVCVGGAACLLAAGGCLAALLFMRVPARFKAIAAWPFQFRRAKVLRMPNQAPNRIGSNVRAGF